MDDTITLEMGVQLTVDVITKLYETVHTQGDRIKELEGELKKYKVDVVETDTCTVTI